MIRKKMRIHVIAIGIISLVIIMIFLATQPKKIVPVGDQQLMGDRYIQIYSATWGESCNKYIAEAIANPPPPKRDEKGRLIEVKLPSRVATDNVLDVLNTTCNGKLSCELQATSVVLGVEPLPSCYKDLNVIYRCYTMDRLWPTTTHQGDILKIDCNEKTAEPAASDADPAAQDQPQQ